MMNKVKRFLSAVIFPQRCPYCNRLITYEKTACDNCKKELPETYSVNFAKGGYSCCSPFFYKGSYREAVIRFKFHNCPSYSQNLAVVMASCIKKHYDVSAIDYITYVPMHPLKQHERGYNQSKLLARDIGKELGIPLKTFLKKIKDNDPQHKCSSMAQRRENVRGVYKAVNTENIKGKTVLIIDDILTTGYTLGECSRVLEKKSKAKIICATLCAKNDINF